MHTRAKAEFQLNHIFGEESKSIRRQSSMKEKELRANLDWCRCRWGTPSGERNPTYHPYSFKAPSPHLPPKKQVRINKDEK